MTYINNDYKLLIHVLDGAMGLNAAVFLCRKAADYLKDSENHIIEMEKQLPFYAIMQKFVDLNKRNRAIQVNRKLQRIIV